MHQYNDNTAPSRQKQSYTISVGTLNHLRRSRMVSILPKHITKYNGLILPSNRSKKTRQINMPS